jgi:predicted DNA-binding WGR domain protein
MINFEDFLSEGKKLQIKRKYTENHPAQTVGKTANVRNAVLQAIKDGVVTREEFNKILSELSTSSSQWASRNRKYFNVSEEGVKLSKWGRRILAELDETPKAAEVFEATVVMDAMDPKSKILKKLLKKHKVTMKVLDPSGPSGWPEVELTGSREDLQSVLASPDGWDDPELGEYIEESAVNEKIKVTKSDWPNAVVKYKGKKYEIEFDDYDVIDDHGNEGKDLYFMGVDQEGGNWEVDVYADYRDEVEDIHWDTLIYKGIDESVVNEAKFVKDFDKAVLDAETEKDVLKVYPKAEFYVGKMSHFFGELEPNLFFKAYYAKYYKQDTGKSIKGDFKITTVYSEKGSRYVNLHVEESAITENYEVIYSDGVSAMKKFRNEKQALDFMKKTIASNKKLRDIAVYKPGMHSTTQTELVVKFWGDGSYLDNVSKRDKDLAAKKLEENTNMKSEINLFESFSDFVGANFLNEAIKSSILRTVLSNGREGKEAKKNLSNLAKGFYNLSKVALDKIEDEDFIISNDVSKIFKNYGGSSHVLFFISDNEKENPYYDHNNGSWNDYKMVPGGGIVLAAMSGDRQFYANEWSRWAGARSWSKQKKGDVDQIGINHKYRGWGASGLNNGKRIAEMSDRVIVINLELIRQKYSTQQLRDARKAAKADATAFKSDKDFRDANRNRYHKILADKAASLPLDKMVSDAIDKLAKQISDGLKKGEKTRYQEIKIGESPKGKEVKAKDASQHMSNILDDYSRYVDYIRQAEESEARYGEKESYYERESKNYAKQIKERINKIDSFDYAW